MDVDRRQHAWQTLSALQELFGEGPVELDDDQSNGVWMMLNAITEALSPKELKIKTVDLDIDVSNRPSIDPETGDFTKRIDL
ncbi:MAG: hypothetical protein AAF358_13435 [Pseudomonadota bacterium]